MPEETEKQPLKQMTGTDLLILYHQYGQSEVIEQLHQIPRQVFESVKQSLDAYPDAVGMLICSNHDLSDRHIGHNMLLPYGPSNTYKVLPGRGERSPCPKEFRDSVRGHSYYFDAWCTRESMLEAIAEGLYGSDVL